MNFSRLGLAATLTVSFALPAAAQSVSIQFHDGLVTLNARNVPVRAILAEWARVGGAKILNGDRVSGESVTLELTNAPERQALDVLLRGVSGYIVAGRQATSNGASSFDRILILPTSTVVRTVSAPGPAFAPPPGPTFVLSDDPEENPREDIAPGPNQPGSLTPAQVQQRLRDASLRAAAQRAAEADAEANQLEQDQQQPQTQGARPGNPFGTVRGTSRPGEITPVPKQPQRNPLRPNGDPEP
jgi:hypothetical protein